MQRRGFTRVKVDGTLYEIGEVPSLNRKIKHEIEAVVDRIVVRDGIAPRLADSFETALALSDGVVYAEHADAKGSEGASAPCSPRASPARCPASPSRRSSRGCSASTARTAPARPATASASRASSIRNLVVPDERLSLADGAIMPWTGAQSPYYDQTLQSLARHFKVTTRTPWHDLPERVRDAILNGTGEEPVAFTYKDGVRAYTVTKPFEGVLRNLQRRWQETDSVWVREELVPLSGGEALRRLQRRAAEAGSAGGAGRRQEHRRGVRTVDPRGCCVVRHRDRHADAAAPGDRPAASCARSASGCSSWSMSGWIT